MRASLINQNLAVIIAYHQQLNTTMDSLPQSHFRVDFCLKSLDSVQFLSDSSVLIENLLIYHLGLMTKSQLMRLNISQL